MAEKAFVGMGRTSFLISNFLGGEVSEEALGRVDLEKYYSSCLQLKNFQVRHLGGIYKADGYRFAHETKYSSKKSRLVRFEFNRENKYALEFGDYYIRVFKNGVLQTLSVSDTDAWVTETVYAAGDFVDDGALVYRCILGHTASSADEPGEGENWETYWVQSNIFEVVTPYGEDDVAAITLKYVQSADILYLTCPSYQQRRLSRYGDTDWVMDLFPFKNGPFMNDNNDSDHELTITAYSGSEGYYGEIVTVTSTDDMFVAADVGRWLKFAYTEPGDDIDTGARDVSGAGVLANGPWEVDGKFELVYYFSGSYGTTITLQYSTDGGTIWQSYEAFPDYTSTTRITIQGELRSEDYNNVVPQLRFYSDGDTSGSFHWGIKKVREERTGILKITSFSTAKIVLAEVYERCTQLGVPSTKWALGAWGDTPGWPSDCTFFQNRMWFNGTLIEPHALHSSISHDYYDFKPGADDDNAISHELSAEEVSAIKWIKAKRFLMAGSMSGEWVLMSSNDEPISPTNTKPLEDTNCGSSDLHAIVLGGDIVFVQYDKKHARTLSYSVDNDAYYTPDLTLLAPHILGDGVVDLCAQKEPNPYAHFVTEDGRIPSLCYLPEQKIWAWTDRDTQNGLIESSICVSGYQYVIVNRTIDGETKRYVEYSTPWDKTLANSFFVDCGVEKTYEEATDVIEGLEHLEGETVLAFNGAEALGEYVVEDGSITVSEEVTKVVVGLKISSICEPVPFEIPRQGGSSQGYYGRVTGIVVRLWKSMGGQIGPDSDTLQDIDTGDGLYTGKLAFHVDGGYADEPTIYIKHEDPTPFNILCLVPETDITP